MSSSYLSGSAANLHHDLSQQGGTGLHNSYHVGNVPNANQDDNKLGLSDYIAIGVCVGFLGLVYVVAISIFLMLKRKRKRKERIRQQFLLPPSTMPPGLGYKSSRILGLEEAFIPELRKIEPIPSMSEANLARLQRRRQALEEERRAKLQAVRDDHRRGGGDYAVTVSSLSNDLSIRVVSRTIGAFNDEDEQNVGTMAPLVTKNVGSVVTILKIIARRSNSYENAAAIQIFKN